MQRGNETLEALEEAARLLKAGPQAARPAELPTLKEIEDEHYRDLLAFDETMRKAGDGKRGLLTADHREKIFQSAQERFPGLRPDAPRLEDLGPAFGMNATHRAAYDSFLEEEADALREAFAGRDPSILEGDIKVYFKRKGLRYDDQDPEHYEAALAILKGASRATAARLARSQGNDVPTPEAALPAAKGPKFSEAYLSWKTGSSVKGGRQRAANTLREAETAVRYFVEWVGDKPVGSITKQEVRDFRNALQRKPTGLSAKQRSMPLRALLQTDLSGLPAVHGNTVNKTLAILAGIVAEAEAEGLLDGVQGFATPFKGIKSHVDPRQDGERQAFDESDLGKIFGTSIYSGGTPPKGGGGAAAYWLPLVSLLSGARLEELAQLRVCDLKRDDAAGSWFLDIRTSGGRSIKTANSRRLVPVHPQLERIGLIRYRACRAKSGSEAPLWPDLKSDVKGKRSAAWSKWFSRWLHGPVGISERTKVFHSFRHTFKRLGRDAGLTEEMHDAVTGHAGGGGVGRVYGRGFGSKALAREVRRIEAPAAVSGLRWDPKPGHGGNLVDAPTKGTPSSTV
ncbi:MAG: integrase [Ancylobacter novellus]|uniref:Integrase n=1 Tax=Ancylobacter novellus TaxID=921 RepID=A0A2W5KFE2_ANCNO|nr:MAG: integrase [Ancylobacter novellus]